MEFSPCQGIHPVREAPSPEKSEGQTQFRRPCSNTVNSLTLKKNFDRLQAAMSF